jgi:arylsulfatase A-like enzyme
MRRAIDLYDGEIRYADDHVGRIIDAARARAGRENLLVIVTGDHGETLGEARPRYGYALDHSWLLLPSELHVPLVVCWPGRIEAGRRIGRDVGIASVAPTVLDLLGDAPAGEVPSLAPLLRGEDPPAPPLLLERRLFFEPPRPYLSVPEHGILADGWLYVENALRGRFLHDLGADPSASRNRVADEPERAEALARRLRVLLLRHPRTAVDPDDLPEDRAEALRGLNYHR